MFGNTTSQTNSSSAEAFDGYKFSITSASGYGFSVTGSAVYKDDTDHWDLLAAETQPEVLGYSLILEDQRAPLDENVSSSGYQRPSIEICFDRLGSLEGLRISNPWNKNPAQQFSREQSIYLVSQWRDELLLTFSAAEGLIKKGIGQALLDNRISFKGQYVFGQSGFSVEGSSVFSELPRAQVRQYGDTQVLSLIENSSSVIKYGSDFKRTAESFLVPPCCIGYANLVEIDLICSFWKMSIAEPTAWHQRANLKKPKTAGFRKKNWGERRLGARGSAPGHSGERINGAPGGLRTPDPMIKSHLLYQLSY